MKVSRSDVLGLRVRAQQLDRDGGGTVADTAVLDFGAQDTGPDGALWALAVRGLTEVDDQELVWLWTLRGAPHAYRRSDLASVATAVAPWSDADAAKRIFDASKPLKAAGIGTIEALDEVAAAMRRIVTKPTVKGERVDRADRSHARALPPVVQPVPGHPPPRDAVPARGGAGGARAAAGHVAAGAPAGARLPGGATGGCPARARAGVPPVPRSLDAAAGGRLPRRAGHRRQGAMARRRRRGRPGRTAALAAGRRRRPAGGTAGHHSAAGARTTSTCRARTGRCWWTTGPAPRRCGRSSGAPAPCSSTERSRAAGGRGRRAGGCGSRSCCGRPTRTARTGVADQAERLAAHRGVGLAGVDID